jgi:hypothetical protein
LIAWQEGLMGDHLALLVDRLLMESTLEAAIRKQMVDLQPETVAIQYCRGGHHGGGTVSKVVECRICQEDWDTSMEAPCACCGSLKVVMLLTMPFSVKTIAHEYAAELWH